MGGVTIPAGAQVIINLASACHDETSTCTPRSSTSTDPTCDTWRSATASTSAWAPRFAHGGALALGALFAALSRAAAGRRPRRAALGARRRPGAARAVHTSGRARAGGRPVVTPDRRADVVIVGGGLLGLATAYALRGERTVTVLERETIGTGRGVRPNGDLPARVCRLALRRDGTALARGVPRSRRVRFAAPVPDAATDLRAGRRRGVSTRSTAAGEPVEQLRATEVAQRFPSFAGHGDAVLEPASAVIDAESTLRVLRNHCGATIVEHANVERLDEHRVEVGGGAIEAETVVVCAGPWARTLVPARDPRRSGTSRTCARAPRYRSSSTSPSPPCTACPRRGAISTRSRCTTAARPSTRSPSSDPTPPRSMLLHAAIAKWMPDSELVEIDVCPYDNTRDESFIVEDARPGDRRRDVRSRLQVRSAPRGTTGPAGARDADG